MADSDTLVDVFVPGSVGTATDTSSGNNNPLLNPHAPVPPFVEDSSVASACRPGALAGDESRAWAVASFDDLMGVGLDIAKKRHEWRFHHERLVQQRAKVDSYSARLQPGHLERLRREEEIYQAQQQKRKEDIARYRAQGLSDQEIYRRLVTESTSMRGARPIARTVLHQLPAAIDGLEHNAAVLAARDERLKQQELAYARELVALYRNAFARFESLPAAQRSLDVLNAFDSFRLFQIVGCATRGIVDDEAERIVQAVNQRYMPLVQQTVDAAAPHIVAQVRQSRSSSEIDPLLTRLLPTPLLREVANDNASIAQSVQQQRQTLTRIEDAQHAEALRRAEEELARIAAAQRQRYRDNAKNNVAPTTDEVAKLYAQYAGAKAGKRFSRIDISGNSFSATNILLGMVFPLYTQSISVRDMKCSPSGNVQRCDVSASLHFMDRGLITTTESNDSHNFSATFRWTEEGLHSEAMQRESQYRYYERASASPGPGRTQSFEDAFRERCDLTKMYGGNLPSGCR